MYVMLFCVCRLVGRVRFVFVGNILFPIVRSDSNSTCYAVSPFPFDDVLSVAYVDFCAISWPRISNTLRAIGVISGYPTYRDG